METDRLFSRQEAADYLGIHVNTLDAERSAGRLAYVQRCKSGKVWITGRAIADYLAKATHPVLVNTPLQRDTYRKKRT